VDRGAPGKGPKRIGTLKKGLLSKYGYSSQKPMNERHAALRKAVVAYGPLSVLRKLNAVAVYTRRTAPAVSAIFKADMAWVRSSFEFKTDK
jgi:CRISPR/Cas system Type II protein with McrA/HNH and RuvC-like nuclease domain